MASAKLTKHDTTGDKEIQVPREVVPQMATHFESLSDKVKGTNVSSGEENPVGDARSTNLRQETQGTWGVEKGEQRGVERQGREIEGKEREEARREGIKEGDTKKGGEGEGVGEKERELTLEEITNLRQAAQQKSVDAIKALEEKYQKAMEKLGQGVETTSQQWSEETKPVKDTLADKTQQAKGSITVVAESAGGYAANTTRQAKEKAVEAKDRSFQTVQQAAEFASQKAAEAKDRTAQAVEQAKEYTSDKAASAKERASTMAEGVKGNTVGTAQKVGAYVGEKAVAAKDAAVGAGKTAVGYTEKVAVEAKDRAVVAGLGAAEYTTEKTVEATKAAAGAVGGMAGYVGEKVGAAKDAVVSLEESAAEYTAKKKAEAERKLEASKRGGDQEEHDVESWSEGSGGTGAIEKGGGYEVENEEPRKSVLHAIGETLVEIAQTTKHLVIGSDRGHDSS